MKTSKKRRRRLVEGVEDWDGIGLTTSLVLEDDQGRRSNFSWFHAHIEKLMQNFAEQPVFARALMQGRRSTPGEPWHVAIYTDEIVPGNPLAQQNHRKAWAWYVSFLEFGAELLCHAEYWMPVAVIRNEVVKNVKGGLSAVARALFRHMFLERDWNSCGLLLRPKDSPPFLFWAKLAHIFGDEAALKAIWGSKGASGLVPCFQCLNVVSSRSELATHQAHTNADYSRPLVHIGCADASLLHLATDADIWEKHDMLQRQQPILGKGAFEELEKTLGLRYVPEGVLADIGLRAHVRPTHNTYDPFHCTVAGGIAQHETFLFLKHLQTLGVTWEHVRQLMLAWQCPGWKRSSVSMSQVFTHSRRKSCKEAFKATGAEMLSVYPVLRYIADVVVDKAAARAQVKSFKAMCAVVDKTRPGLPRHSQVVDAVQKHLRAFSEAYPDEDCIPKHHFCMHLRASSAGMLLTTFVCERKHIMVKKCAAHVTRPELLEKACLLKTWVEQRRQLQEFQIPSLLGRQHPLDGLAFGPAVAAKYVRLASGLTIAVDDVVVIDDRDFFCKVVACVKLIHDGRLVLLAEPLHVVERLGSKVYKCAVGSPWMHVEASRCKEVARNWSADGPNEFIVLL
jgi:hypothetical protein